MGGSLVGQLQEGLEQSQAGILIWSSATADSKWVQREYATMEARTDNGDFNFIPVLLDESKLPTFAQNRVFLDFTRVSRRPEWRRPPSVAACGRWAIRSHPRPCTSPQSRTMLRAASWRRSRRACRRVIHDGLVALFNAGGLAMETSSAPGCAVAEGLTALRTYGSALDVLDRGPAKFPNSIRPQQLRALALARRAEDDLQAAQSTSANCKHWGTAIPKHSDLRPHLDGPLRRSPAISCILRHSRDLYAEAFEGAQDDYYVGINAAAKSVLLGDAADIERGRALARQVQQIVGGELVRGDYWKTATVAEALLILGDFEKRRPALRRRGGDGAKRARVACVHVAAGVPVDGGAHSLRPSHAR